MSGKESMVRTHTLVIISVSPWLEAGWVSFMYSVHASDYGPAHSFGCTVNGISAKTIIFVAAAAEDLTRIDRVFSCMYIVP